MQEGVVKVGALEGWHAAIGAGLAVEDKVNADKRSAEDARAIEKALTHIARTSWALEGLLLVAAPLKRCAKKRARLRERRRSKEGSLREWRFLMECTDRWFRDL